MSDLFDKITTRRTKAVRAYKICFEVSEKSLAAVMAAVGKYAGKLKVEEIDAPPGAVAPAPRRKRAFKKLSPARDAVRAWIKSRPVGTRFRSEELRPCLQAAGCSPSTASPAATWAVRQGLAERMPNNHKILRIP